MFCGTAIPKGVRVAGEKRRIARAAGIVSALTLLSRITGLVRDVVVGYLFGAGVAAEAFFLAFRFPNFFRRLVAEGAMSVAIVPVFSDLLAAGRDRDAERGLRALLGVALVAFVILAAIGVGLAPLWVDVVAPGFADDTGLHGLAVRLARLLFPYLVLIGAVAILAGYLNAARHFVAPALSPAVLNVVIIVSAVGLRGLFEIPVEALAYGVLAGGACQLALQVLAVRARGVRVRPVWQPRHEAVRRSAVLMLPATAGTAIFQFNVLVGTVLASLLPVGSISYLWYADRIFEFPLGLFVAALGTAALPSMASQAARGEIAGMRDSLSFAMGLMNFIAVPATLGLILLAEPIVGLLFERGAFSADDTLMTARALRCYALGLWSVAAVRLLAPAFYAVGDARTPMRVAVAAVAVNVLASIALMGPVSREAAPDWLRALIAGASFADLDHAGLALGTSVAATVNAGVLGWLIVRRLGGLDLVGFFGSLLRSVAACLPMSVVVSWMSRALNESLQGDLAVRAAAVGSIVGLGIAAYLMTALVVGGREISGLRRLASERIARLRS